MADKKKKVRSVKDTPRHKVGVVLGTGFFVILCAIIVFPVFAGLLASFRPGKELIRRGLSIDLDFSTMSLDNYTYLFSGNADSQKYFMWYKNSLIITIVSVVLTLLICYFVAYGLTMYNYRLKNFLFFLVIATMMVPFEILMLPLYKEIIAIGLNTLLTPYGNNYDVLIAGSMFGILPIFIIFLIFQKYIIDGMTAGAVKG